MENKTKLFDGNERVNVLKEYNVLDSLPEEDYDDLTKLAAEICKTKLAVITFIDGNRQWIKSKFGEGLNLTNIPLSSSFCIHTLNTTDVVVVSDCSKDVRFSESPLVKEDPKIIFYAGAPLITPDGFALGSICVLDKKQKELTTAQTNALQILAKQVMKLLELRRMNNALVSNKINMESKFAELERFSYAIAHDLRGPAKNVSALIGLLNLHLKSGSEEEIKSYMVKIVKENDRMNKLVADLLEFSLLGKEKQTKEWISVAELLDDVKLTMEQKLREYNVDIEYFETVSKVFAVKSDMIRLFQNILENAVKYSRVGHTPKINVSFTEEKNYWKFSIKDNGIGISKEGSEKIFEVFTRLQTGERYQGTGIGLATCKRIVENYNGKIWVESLPGQGSTFHFLLEKTE